MPGMAKGCSGLRTFFYPQFRLVIDIRQFHFDASGQPAALVDVYAKIIDELGDVVATERFQSEIALETGDKPVVASGMQTLFTQTATDLIKWTLAAL